VWLEGCVFPCDTARHSLRCSLFTTHAAHACVSVIMVTAVASGHAMQRCGFIPLAEHRDGAGRLVSARWRGAAGIGRLRPAGSTSLAGSRPYVARRGTRQIQIEAGPEDMVQRRNGAMVGAGERPWSGGWNGRPGTPSMCGAVVGGAGQPYPPPSLARRAGSSAGEGRGDDRPSGHTFEARREAVVILGSNVPGGSHGATPPTRA